MRSRPLHAVVSVTVAAVLAGCAGAPERPAAASIEASGFPHELSSCGFTVTLPSPPTAVVTMNQTATEIVLALDAADQLAGTAYLDDEIAEQWQEAYDAVPVLADQYADSETILAAGADLVIGSWISAFSDEAAGSREALRDSGIASYLSPFSCEDPDARAAVNFDSVWAEIADIATALGVPERAEQLKADQQDALARLADQAPGAGLNMFWYDSGDKSAYAGTGDGGPQIIIDAVGGTNIFADVPGSWADVSWERVVAADPDVIVLADAGWSSAQDKITHLGNDPVLSQLRAVEAGAFVIVPFSETVPGARMLQGVERVAAQLADLGR
ncbi:ABC transporter substrate-binding protein [Nocardioides limicola]|uniref:ABC transporter substrate-binding protein n=1 Tax=Nocardioides limicola TaxID=2803368 RepID=UPI00193BB330|nr:ABC transporter substrate-binding protein [Nocardioides sp. DJM-14]